MSISEKEKKGSSCFLRKAGEESRCKLNSGKSRNRGPPTKKEDMFFSKKKKKGSL